MTHLLLTFKEFQEHALAHIKLSHPHVNTTIEPTYLINQFNETYNFVDEEPTHVKIPLQ